MREREQDWGGNLVWIFDGTEAHEAERLTLRRHPNRPPGDAYRHVKWAHASARVRMLSRTRRWWERHVLEVLAGLPPESSPGVVAEPATGLLPAPANATAHCPNSGR